MRPQLLLIILFMSAFPLSVFAQEDLSHYLDDGGIATSYRLFKVGYDPVNGEIPLIFEHRISRHISVEWGTGLVSLKRQSKLYEDIEKSSGTGYNVWANLRVYLKGYYERFYMGFQPRINFLDGKTYTDIVFFNGGYQRPVYGRLVIDINAGMGVRSYKEENGRGSAFFIPVQFKIGYAF